MTPAGPPSGPAAEPAGASALTLLQAHPAYAPTLARLRERPLRWLVTGAAGFIGSHLTETLLRCGQSVTGLDDLSTGARANLEDVRARVGEEAWARFRFLEGDITDPGDLAAAVDGADRVLHHAAFVSVPASIEDPEAAHHINATGFLRVLEAARRAGVGRVVYAASSASYGDDDAPVKREERLGRPLSMYAASKTVNELYAAVYANAYGLDSVGFRYFNIFGPRQDPRGAYAAVIPAWVEALAQGRRCRIHGDGLTTRDFCHVANVVGANLLAATTDDAEALNRVYNIGTGGSTTLAELFTLIREVVLEARPDRADVAEATPEHGPFRPGDVRHSRADVSLAERTLGYRVAVDVRRGLAATVGWFLRDTAADGSVGADRSGGASGPDGAAGGSGARGSG